MKNRKFWAGLLAAAMLLTALPNVRAASSSEIQSEIDALEAQQNEIQEKMAVLEAELNANWESTEEMVAYKNNLDQQIFLLHSEMENLDQQIASYRTLIMETQLELDEAQRQLDDLNEKYLARVRAMEEEGELSVWEVVFKSSSFMDLIDRLNMMKEIAEADRRMIAQLQEATEQVAQTKAQLESEKASLEESRAAQDQIQLELEEKRAESDAVLQELNESRADLEELHEQQHAEKNALAEQIAQAEKEYNEAKAREEEERRKQEEENRKDEEVNDTTEPDDSDEEEEEEEEENPPAESYWIQPCSYILITSGYGYRSSGWHNGVDFAANRGTPIYASRSGTVTTVRSLQTSYGNYVVINHGDGYSSLYAHMDYYVVSEGEYVSQGELIGYVGSTGNSSGPHLHFTVFYNGSTVNPMDLL